MFDFAPSFEKMERISALLERAQKIVKKHEAALKMEAAKIVAPLEPFCKKAIEEYNSTGGYLVLDSQSISIDRTKKTLSLFVRWRHPNMGEPDDEFDDSDIERYNEHFGAVMNKHLRENSVPLTFGSLYFPTHYYMK